MVASAVEILRTKSFAYLSEEERQRVARLIRELTIHVPIERTRRMRAANKGSTLDVRRTLRRSLRTQGEPFDRAWRARRTRTRPLVLILDVSGSMAPYSRALLQFGYAAMAAGRRVEVFCFGTRLTRVTRVLRTKDPDRAMHEIGRIVADWEGGTRIGESLKSLLDGWSQRAALRGAVVVLCSDGLERGDPQLLRTQMARLRRLALPGGLGQPAQGLAAVRAARPRDGRRPAERRRLPVGSQPREPRGHRVGARSVAAAVRFQPMPVDDIVLDEPATEGAPPRLGGRGFWVVAAALVFASVFVIVEIFANLGMKDTIGHAEHSLEVAQAAAELDQGLRRLLR